MAAKKKETIEIPLALARLLLAEKDDLKNPEQHADVQELAKASLRVLVLAAE